MFKFTRLGFSAVSRLRRHLSSFVSVCVLSTGFLVLSGSTAANAACNTNFDWTTSVSLTRYTNSGWCIERSGHKVTFQTDGNLVYRKDSTVVWSSGTYGHSAARLRFQTNGDMVIYDGNTPLWASRTAGTCNLRFSTYLMYYTIGGPETMTFEVRGCSTHVIAGTAF